jgi:hypothetical protein
VDQLFRIELLQEELEYVDLLFGRELLVLDSDVCIDVTSHVTRYYGGGRRTDTALHRDVERSHSVCCEDQDSVIVLKDPQEDFRR